MKKLLDAHPYQDPTALNRLLLIVAVFIRQPGIGCPTESNLGSTGAHLFVKPDFCSFGNPLIYERVIETLR